MPLRVSIEAVWPIWMSLACVSAILSSALSRDGLATRARLVPGATCWPTSTGTTCSTPAKPARTCSSSTCRCFSSHHRARLIDLGLLHREPRLHRLGVARELLLGDVVARRRAARRRASTASAISVETSCLVGQLLVDLRLQRRLLVVGLDAGRRRLPAGRSVVLELDAQVRRALASAALSLSSASCSSCSSVGLLSSRMTVSGVTPCPAWTTIRSTRPLVVAGIQRMSSGTSVPMPRTWRASGRA